MSATFLMCAAKNGWLAERWAAFLQITFWYVRTYVYSYRSICFVPGKLSQSYRTVCKQQTDVQKSFPEASVSIHTKPASWHPVYKHVPTHALLLGVGISSSGGVRSGAHILGVFCVCV